MGKIEKKKNSVITLHNYVLDVMDITPIEAKIIEYLQNIGTDLISVTYIDIEAESKKKYWKMYEDGKFAYCNKCHDRMNRLYERKKNSGAFVGIGWNCSKCKILCYD